MKVRSARVSLGSHDQYRPHDVLAHTAPVIMPSPSSHSAGYSAASDMTCILFSVFGDMMAVAAATKVNPNNA